MAAYTPPVPSPGPRSLHQDVIDTYYAMPARQRHVIISGDATNGTLASAMSRTQSMGLRVRAGDTAYFDSAADERERAAQTSLKIWRWLYGDEKDPSSVLINAVSVEAEIEDEAHVLDYMLLCDGLILVVDINEGLSAKEGLLLRLALRHRLRPLLAIGGMEKVTERMLAARASEGDVNAVAEDVYGQVRVVLAAVHEIITAYGDPTMDWRVSPLNGTVVFMSSSLEYSFTLADMAYYKTTTEQIGGVSPLTLDHLWGDSFWDATTRHWRSTPVASSSTSGAWFPRGFTVGVLEALMGLNGVWPPLHRQEPRRDSGFVPPPSPPPPGPFSMGSLLRAVVEHLPSPVTAHAYRIAGLYSGPLDDPYAQGMQRCDTTAPLMVLITGMVIDYSNSYTPRFLAMGRVFAGAVGQGSVCAIMGAQYEPSRDTKSEDYFDEKRILKVFTCNNGYIQSQETLPAGNLVLLRGLDPYLVRRGTVIEGSRLLQPPLPRPFPFRHAAGPLAHRSHLVMAHVRVHNPAQLPFLVEGLKRATRYLDTNAAAGVDEQTGMHYVRAGSEGALRRFLNTLSEFMPRDGGGLDVSAPMPCLRETITRASSRPLFVKSANRHNRFTAEVVPLTNEFLADLKCLDMPADRGTPTGAEGVKGSEILASKYGWTGDMLRRLWCVTRIEGDEAPACLLYNAMEAKDTPSQIFEVQSIIIAAFKAAMEGGPFLEAPVHGVRVNILSALLHTDTIHRSNNQVFSSIKRMIHGAMLLADPVLMEPVLDAEVTCPVTEAERVHTILRARGGKLSASEPVSRPAPNTVEERIAYKLAAAHSFGLPRELLEHTPAVFSRLSFSHWAAMEGSALDPATRAGECVVQARTMRGIRTPLPVLSEYESIP